MPTFSSLHRSIVTGAARVLFGWLVLVTLVCCSAGQVQAQEIHLRRSANITGSLVTLGEIADIDGGSDEERQALRGLVLAPYSAERSVWTAREVREELVAAGWNLLYWEVTGANQVQLHGDDANANPIDPQRKLAAVQGRPRPLRENSAAPTTAAASMANFPVTSPAAQRTGVVQAQWQPEDLDQDSRYDALAIGSVRRPTITSTVWVFRRDMGRGQVVTAEDLEQMTLARTLPTQAVLDANLIVGQVLRSAVPAGRPILSQNLEPIKHVQRAKEVTLLSRVGPIEVSTTARSLADATLGQSVTIESLDRKRQFLGQVIGFNTVQVIANQQTPDSAIVAQVTAPTSQRSGNALRMGQGTGPRDSRLR